MPKQIELSEVVLRQKLSTRGGGIEIDLSRFGFKGEKMSAYQNYLGGGMLGRVCANDTIRSQSFYVLNDKQEAKLDKIAERLKRYFHDLTNPADQEWENQSYEQNQKLPSSAY
jgi:predicted AlkP superfamily phosphohydrolase/phosphomutase